MLSLKPMRPGVHIMRQLRLPTKLGLLALVLLVPMLVVGVLLVQRVNESIRFTEAEVDGSKLVQTLSAVVGEVQKHRGQTNMLLSGDAGAREALQATRKDLRVQLDAVEHMLAARPDFGLNAEWASLSQSLKGVASGEQTSATESFAFHSGLIRDLRHFIYTTAERSNLLFLSLIHI